MAHSPSFSIKEMAPDERPRERLKLRGAASLNDAELLALILNTGVVGESVVPRSTRLFEEHRGVRGRLKLELGALV